LWIEVEYGKEKLEEASTMNLTNFSDEKVRTEFCNRFPIVGQRLNRYEEFVKDVSSEWESELKIRYAGERGGFAAAFVHARIPASGLNLQSKLSQMKRAIEALDDSLNAICKYDLARLKEVREGGVSD